MSTRGYPWYRTSHRCWYVWHKDRQVRLHPDEDEAFALWHRLEAGLLQPAASGPSLDEVVSAYLDHCRAALRESSARIKAQKLAKLTAARGREPACSFDAAAADAFLKSVPSWKAGTRWIFACAVRACLRWAEGDGLIPSYPLDGWKVPRPGGRSACVVSADTHRKLLEVSPPHLHDLLVILEQTGCRPGEAYAVTAADWRAGCWFLKEHKTSGRSGSVRVVHLTPTADSLCARLAQASPSGPLLRNSRGRPMRHWSVCQLLASVCRRNGLPHVYPYAYRHTYATDCLAAGVPDAHVAELLGHRGTRMLHEHYAHLCEHSRELRESLSRARK